MSTPSLTPLASLSTFPVLYSTFYSSTFTVSSPAPSSENGDGDGDEEVEFEAEEVEEEVEDEVEDEEEQEPHSDDAPGDSSRTTTSAETQTDTEPSTLLTSPDASLLDEAAAAAVPNTTPFSPTPAPPIPPSPTQTKRKRPPSNLVPDPLPFSVRTPLPRDVWGTDRPVPSHAWPRCLKMILVVLNMYEVFRAGGGGGGGGGGTGGAAGPMPTDDSLASSLVERRTRLRCCEPPAFKKTKVFGNPSPELRAEWESTPKSKSRAEGGEQGIDGDDAQAWEDLNADPDEPKPSNAWTRLQAQMQASIPPSESPWRFHRAYDHGFHWLTVHFACGGSQLLLPESERMGPEHFYEPDYVDDDLDKEVSCSSVNKGIDTLPLRNKWLYQPMHLTHAYRDSGKHAIRDGLNTAQWSLHMQRHAYARSQPSFPDPRSIPFERFTGDKTGADHLQYVCQLASVRPLLAQHCFLLWKAERTRKWVAEVALALHHWTVVWDLVVKLRRFCDLEVPWTGDGDGSLDYQVMITQAGVFGHDALRACLAAGSSSS